MKVLLCHIPRTELESQIVAILIGEEKMLGEMGVRIAYSRSRRNKSQQGFFCLILCIWVYVRVEV